MATNTYVALQTQTITSAVSEVIFSSIPQGYTDLILIAYNKSTGGYNPLIRVGNGTVDTGSNYSVTYMNSASPYAGSSINRANMFSDNITTSNFMPEIYQFMNYSNTTTYKTFLWRHSDTDSVSMWVGNWRSTSAIDTISITYGDTSNAMIAGITFTLYGIKAEGQSYATGGYITSDANYYYHTFTSSGTFIPQRTLSCDYLVVAGGAGGGSGNITWVPGGGGGAGGYRTTVGTSGGGASAESQLSVTSGTSYTVTIGAGGAGGLYGAPFGTGTNGSNSVFGSITSLGGSGGGAYLNSAATGGSGGGGSNGGSSGTNVAGSSGTANQGYNGGSGTWVTSYELSTGGGGGGAGSAGANGNALGSSTGGSGGSGITSIISGTSTTYAGGGGGAGVISGPAGLGGGGAGAQKNGNTGGSGTAGTANTGGGGGGSKGGAGGGLGTDFNGAAGGSGIVIVRYAK